MSNGSNNSDVITISVVIDEETQAWLKQQAKIEDRSVSSLVRTAITEYRDRQEARKEAK